MKWLAWFLCAVEPDALQCQPQAKAIAYIRFLVLLVVNSGVEAGWANAIEMQAERRVAKEHAEEWRATIPRMDKDRRVVGVAHPDGDSCSSLDINAESNSNNPLTLENDDWSCPEQSTSLLLTTGSVSAQRTRDQSSGPAPMSTAKCLARLGKAIIPQAVFSSDLRLPAHTFAEGPPTSVREAERGSQSATALPPPWIAQRRCQRNGQVWQPWSGWSPSAQGKVPIQLAPVAIFVTGAVTVVTSDHWARPCLWPEPQSTN